MKLLRVTMLAAVLLPMAAAADEGMWTFDNFPKDKVQKKYGVTVDDAWLSQVKLGSVRLAQGCSGSIVSADGLVMTNHHCAHACVEQLSTAQKDFVKSGFYAKTLADEVKYPDHEINQLTDITDVTARVRKATEGLADQKYNEAEKAALSQIEKECATSDSVRCDVVSLYRGGLYHLYKYRRFQDVRLVFAPEFSIAMFGGDPDNFNFPRYDLDVAFLRVWDGSKPVAMDHYLHWSASGAKDGELVFVTGNPGSTSRQLTVAQLEYARDVALPDRLLRLAEMRGFLTEYQRRGPEQERHSTELLFEIENAYKGYRGRWGALVDKPFFTTLVENEKKLRAAAATKPEWQGEYGGVWDRIAQAQEVSKGIRKPYNFLESSQGFQGDLYVIAKTLVRAAEERGKPIETRFREYRDSALPAVTARLFSEAPVYDELEIALLTFSLTKLREELGADDPAVHKILGTESPEDLAARVVKGTRLKDVAARRALWDGGKDAVAASDDPMIELAKKVDPDARAVRKRFEDEVEAPVKKNAELLARLRFAITGTSAYPDATFTPRLSYGAVKGWSEPGREVPPFTFFRGAFERATGRPPFELPETWIGAKGRLNLETPFNLTTTNDIIGGNSGSPLINAKAEIVGLIFDGNIHSLGGEYGFDETKNRAVAVHSAALLEALAKIYNADRVVRELRAAAPAAVPKKK